MTLQRPPLEQCAPGLIDDHHQRVASGDGDRVRRPAGHEQQDAGVQRLLILPRTRRPFTGNHVEKLVPFRVRVLGERLVQLDERRVAGRRARQRGRLSRGAPHVVLLDERRKVDRHRREVAGRRDRFRCCGLGLWRRGRRRSGRERDLHVHGRTRAGDELALQGNETLAIEPQAVSSCRHVLEDNPPALSASVLVDRPLRGDLDVADAIAGGIAHEDRQRGNSSGPALCVHVVRDRSHRDERD